MQLSAARQAIAAALFTLCAAQTVAQTAPQAPAPSPVAAPSLKAVLESARARVQQADVRATGRLVQVSANGMRVSNAMTLASHAFPDGVRTMLTITTPDHTQLRYLLTQNENGHTSIEARGKEGAAQGTALPIAQWAEGIAGTLFAPEDFSNGQFFWAKQTLLPAQKYGARDCILLKSEPSPGQATQYAAVTTWIDRKTGAPVFVEATPKSGGPAKQFVFFGIEQLGGIWTSRHVEATLNGKQGSTILLIDRGSPHAHLQRKDFNLAAPNLAAPDGDR